MPRIERLIRFMVVISILFSSLPPTHVLANPARQPGTSTALLATPTEPIATPSSSTRNPDTGPTPDWAETPTSVPATDTPVATPPIEPSSEPSQVTISPTQTSTLNGTAVVSPTATITPTTVETAIPGEPVSSTPSPTIPPTVEIEREAAAEHIYFPLIVKSPTELVQAAVSTNLIQNSSFEDGQAGWAESRYEPFPGTSFWRMTWGTAAPHSGTYGYSISNLANGVLVSRPIVAKANMGYDLSAFIRGELDPNSSEGGGWMIRANCYRSDGSFISALIAASGGPGSLDTTWRRKGARITTPSGTATLRIALYNYLNSGWVAFDDVSLIKAGEPTNSAPDPGFEQGTGWTASSDFSYPATSFLRATWGTASPRSGGYAYTISNHAYGALVSDPISIVAGVKYNLNAWLRGELNPNSSEGGGWLLLVNYYRSDNSYMSTQHVAFGAAGSITTNWIQTGGQFTPPNGATTLRIALHNYMSTGWLAYDDVSLVRVGQTSNLVPNPSFEGSTGWTEWREPNFPGTSFWRSNWGTAVPHSGSYGYTISNHAYGSLLSDPIAANDSSQYDLLAWVRGELDPNSSEAGGWIVRANFYRSDGSFISSQDAASGGPSSLNTTWSQKGGRITTPSGTARVRIELYNYLNSGWVAFDDVSLSYVGAAPDTTITGLNAANNSPTLAGQATNFTATVTAGTNVNYTWAFGDGTTGSGMTASHIYANPGTYPVVVTASNAVNTATATTLVTVIGQPSLAIAKTGPSSVAAATPITYTLTVTNSGTAAATNLVISDAIPAGAYYVSGGTRLGNEVRWNMPSLASGATTQVSFVVTTSTTITNSVYQVSADGGVSAIGVAAIVTAISPPPGADFEATPLSGTAPLTVDFTNTSAHATDYLWDFGDGVTSTAITPTHTYTQIGVYTATLTATGPGGNDTTIALITVTDEPIIGLITTNDSPILLGQPTTLTATNTAGSNVAYIWNFGDGATGTGASLLHTYQAPGTYTAVVTASNSLSLVTATTTIAITGPPNLAISQVAPLSALANNPITYSLIITNSGTLTATNLVITDVLPDGATYVEGGILIGNTVRWTMASLPPNSSRTVQFAVTATEIITNSLYQVTADGGISATGEEVAVTRVYPLVSVDFGATPLAGSSPLTVTFVNSSTNALSYAWDFGDNTESSALVNPTHTYTQPGIYTVTLSAAGLGSSQALSRPSYISVEEPVTADFAATPLTGTIPLTVTFVNNSTGGTSHFWGFGDGATQLITEPFTSPITTSHVYTQAGVYTVTLSTSNGLITETLTQTNYITAHIPLRADFSADSLGGTLPLTVTFVNSSTGGNSHFWDFGDGTTLMVTDTFTSPVTTIHAYTQAGVYTVTLAASNGIVTDTLTRTDYITVAEPLISSFIADPLTGTIPLTITFVTSSATASNFWWDFGDGATLPVTGTFTSPITASHTYTQAGVYTVTLTAGNGVFTNTLTYTDYISAAAPITLTTPPGKVWWNEEFFYRRPLVVSTNTPISYDSAITKVVKLNLDTTPWVADGKMRPDGKDLRVVYWDGMTWTELARQVQNSGTATTSILFPLRTTLTDTVTNAYWLYYGNAVPNPAPILMEDYGQADQPSADESSSIQVDFVAEPITGLAPLEVTLTNLTSPEPASYLWDFGDGHTATLTDSVHTYQNPGVYTITLTANSEGSSSILSWPGLIWVAGLDVSNQARVSLSDPEETPVITATVTASVTDTQVITSAEGTLSVVFPPGAINQDLIITHTPYQAIVNQGGGLLTRFDITAQTTNGQPVTQFSQPLTFTVDLNRYNLDEALAQTAMFFTWNETEQRWEPISTTLFSSNGARLLSGQVNHFSHFMAFVSGRPGGPPSIGAALPTTIADPTSGAATFSIPIEVPPGTAGMQPTVGIGYNSLLAQQETDLKFLAEPGGLLGVGTFLNLSYIGRNNQATDRAVDELSSDDYFLVLDGGWQKLIPESNNNTEPPTRFHTQDENFWRIERIGSTDITGCTNTTNGAEADCAYWKVTSKDGTIYTFGQTPDSIQRALATNQAYNDKLYTYPGRYYLNQVEDVNGNYMLFTYAGRMSYLYTLYWLDEATDTALYDAAVYLTDIRYTGNTGAGLLPQRHIRFNYEPRAEGSKTDFVGSKASGIAQQFYFDQRLASIETMVEPQGSTPVRRYEFGYRYLTRNLLWGRQIHYLTLQNVLVKGQDNTNFPLATRFDYFDVSPSVVSVLPSKFTLLRRVNTYRLETEDIYNSVEYDYNWQFMPFLAGLELTSQWLVSQQIQSAAKIDPVEISFKYNQFTPSRGSGPTANVMSSPNVSYGLYDLWHVTTHDSLSGRTIIQAFYNRSIFKSNPLTGLLVWTEVFSDPTKTCFYSSFSQTHNTCLSVRYLTGQYFTYQQDETASNGDDRATFVAPASVIQAIGPLTSSQPQDWTETRYEYNYRGDLTQQLDLNDPANPQDGRLTRTTYKVSSQAESAANLNRPETIAVYGEGDSGRLLSCQRFSYSYIDPASARLTSLSQETYHGGRNVCAPNGALLDTRSTIGFDEFGNVSGRSGAAGNFQVEYDPIYFTFPMTTTYPTDGDSLVTTATYNPAWGLATQAIAMNGAVTNYSYDAFGRPTSVTTPAADATLTYAYAYDNTGLTLITTQADGLDQLISWQRFNALGQAEFETTEAENGQAVRTSYQYRQGWLWRTSAPHYASQEPTLWTTYQYDAWGRPTAIINPDGTAKRTEYTGWSQQRVIDENQFVKMYYHNALGQVTRVEEYTGTIGNESLYATTNYSYNALGQLTDVLDQAGNLSHMEYDGAGRMTLLQDPDQGEWRYGYSLSGPLTFQESSKGVELSFDYDPQNRLTVITRLAGESGSETYATFTYDAGLNGAGQRAGMTDASGFTGYAYDAAGRLITETKVIDGLIYRTGFSYDPLSRVKTLTYPDGEVITYTYNSGGLLAGLTTPGNMQLTHITYNTFGQPTQIVGNNGLNWQFSYYDQSTTTPNLALRTSSLAVGAANLSFNYRYDPAGHLIHQEGSLGSVSQTLDYTYDSLNRLTSVTGSAGGFDLSRAYSYDTIGNLTGKDGLIYTYSNGEDEPVHAPSQVGNLSFSYDANGNRIRQSQGNLEVNYRYDELNRLAYVISDTLISGAEAGQTVTQAVYDGDGRRIKRITAAGTTVSIGQHYEVFYPASANQTLTPSLEACAVNATHSAPRVFADRQGGYYVVYGNRHSTTWTPLLCTLHINAAGQELDAGTAYTGGGRQFFDLAVDDAARVYQLWQETINGQGYLRLFPSGVESVVSVDVNVSPVIQNAADLAVEGNGTAHVVWTTDSTNNLYYAQVSGQTVTPSPALAEGGAALPQVAVDQIGLAHLVWRQATTTPTGEVVYHIRYSAVGGAAETISTAACPANRASVPVLALDAAGAIYVAWAAPDFDRTDPSGPICFATRAPAGGWTVTPLQRQTPSSHLELQATADGTVYLLRGTRALLDDNLDLNGWTAKGDYSRETLYLERYRNGVWETALANTYPTQDGSGDGAMRSVLEGGLAIDPTGTATLAWIDNGETWQGDNWNYTFRLRTTQILSTTVPQHTKHYFANGAQIASRVDGQLYYTLSDHLGSTSLVVDDQGSEVGHVIYDAYGQIVSNTVPLTLTDRLFTGQVFDASTGLYYYNARYYDPVTGQFTQPDSVVADPLNPAAWNRFSYVYGNPVNYTDPSGHITETPLDLVNLAVDIGFCAFGDVSSCAFAIYDAAAVIIPGLPGAYGNHLLTSGDDALQVARKIEVVQSDDSVRRALRYLWRNYLYLQEREAKFGGNLPMQLIHHIDDHQVAIELAEEVLNGRLSHEEFFTYFWQMDLFPLNNSIIKTRSHPIDLRQVLSKLYRSLHTLQAREAKYGGNVPVELINQIGDYNYAIKETVKALQGSSLDEFYENMMPLILEY